MDQASPDNLDIHRCTSADNGAINACNWDGSVATETRYNNSRYVIIKWKHIDAAALTDPQMAYFAGMEFRYYQRNSSYAGNPADLLKQTDLRWYPVAKFKLNNTATGVQEDSSCSPPDCLSCDDFYSPWNGTNYDSCIIDLPSVLGNYYWFTVKTRNKSNFKLDSLYRTPIAL
jgi:hypothetical protein